MEKQILKFTQRRLADALHLEDLGTEKTNLLAGFKFIMMDLEEVLRTRASTQINEEKNSGGDK